MAEDKFQKALLCGPAFPSRRLKQGPVSWNCMDSSLTSIITDLLYIPSPKQWADAHLAEACPVIQETIQELNKCTLWRTIRHAFKLYAISQVKETERKM